MTKPTTNRESIEGKLVAGREEADAHGPGAFWFDDNPLSIHGILPGGHKFGCMLDGSRGWTWDGNREKPTLNPSILLSITWGEAREYIEIWHGYMRAGKLCSV